MCIPVFVGLLRCYWRTQCYFIGWGEQDYGLWLLPFAWYRELRPRLGFGAWWSPLSLHTFFLLITHTHTHTQSHTQSHLACQFPCLLLNACEYKALCPLDIYCLSIRSICPRHVSDDPVMLFICAQVSECILSRETVPHPMTSKVWDVV